MSGTETIRTSADVPEMSAASSRSFRLAAIFWSITLFAFAVRFFLLDRESAWLDEAFSWGYAKLPLRRLWWEPIDVHPPVYYSILHVLMRFGDTPWMLRMPSAIGGALAIPLLYLLGRRVAGEGAGLGAAALLATSAIEIRYSQEARSYALLASAALVVAIGFAGLFGRPNLSRREAIGWSIVYAGGCIVALYLHYISVLLIGITFALGTLAVLRHRSALSLQSWAITNACILLAWLWWLPVLISQLREGTPQFTLAPPGLSAIAQGIRALYGEAYVFWDWQGGPTFEILLIACALLGAWLSVRRPSLTGACLVAAAFGIPILELVLSWTIKPIFVERTFIWLIPFYLLLVVIGLKALPRVIGIPLFFAVLLMQTIGTVTYFRTEHNTPWSRLAAQVHACASAGDVMLVAPGYLQLPLDYATRNAPLAAKAFDIGVSQGNALMRGVTVEETFTNVRSALTTHPRIWVLTGIDYTGPWFDTGIAPFLRDYHLAGRQQFRDVVLSRYFPPGDNATACGRVG